MVGWFRIVPHAASIVMVAIPFSLVGILPAHGLMGAFFTATSMIGFMAGGGIVVRNSIILVDAAQHRPAVSRAEIEHELLKHVVRPILGDWLDEQTQFSSTRPDDS